MTPTPESDHASAPFLTTIVGLGPTPSAKDVKSTTKSKSTWKLFGNHHHHHNSHNNTNDKKKKHKARRSKSADEGGKHKETDEFEKLAREMEKMARALGKVAHPEQILLKHCHVKKGKSPSAA